MGFVLDCSTGEMTEVPDPPFIPQPVEAPESVTDLQFRLALNKLGLRSAADTYIEAASQDVKDWWDRAQHFELSNQMLKDAIQALGKTEDDLKQVFILASTL